MASAPQNMLPVFYEKLEPLSSETHADFKARMVDKAPFLAKHHAVPLTVDEFVLAQRHFPIVFSAGPDPVPLALMENLATAGAVPAGMIGAMSPASVRNRPRPCRN